MTTEEWLERKRIGAAIVRKDLLEAARNRHVLGALLFPVGMSLFFRLAFFGAAEPVPMTVAVYDPGGSRMVTALRALPRVTVRLVPRDELLAEAVRKDAVGGLAVPVGFDAEVRAGRRPGLVAYVNDRRGRGDELAFRRVVMQQVWALKGSELPARITWVDTSLPRLRPWITFRFERFLLILWLVLGLVTMGTTVVPLLLMEEREKRTFQLLMLSSVRPVEVMAGKAVVGVVYSLLSAAILIAAEREPVGSWPLTGLALLLGSVFLVGLGLLVGVAGRSTAQVSGWSALLVTLLVAPAWLTFGVTSETLRMALRLIPTFYLVRVLRLAISGQGSLAQAGSDLAVLAGGAALAAAAIAWTLRRARA